MILETKKINIEDLKNWTSSDGFPIISFLSVYTACGLLDAIEKYVADAKKESADAGVISVQQIFCNFYTFQKIRTLIQESWSRHYLKLSGDNKVEWMPNKNHNYLSYDRSLNKKISVAITYDAANYACGIDDTLEDDVIIFTDGKDDEDENQDNNQELQTN